MAVGEVHATGSADTPAPVEPQVTDHGSPVAAPQTHGTLYDGIAAGPFTANQLVRLDEALRAADQDGELAFSVYVGELTGNDQRAAANALHERLPDPDSTVLLAVSPNQRVVEIVTGALAAKRLPDRVCALAALSMTSAFSGGDLAGGLVTGLRMLSDQARIP
ncbi:MAG: DUF5130 family protein [Actinocatenispora sp.]